MDVIVMAGGRGTRLWPLTAEQPKPLVPIANRPVLSHVFDLLQRHELGRAALTLGYKGERIAELCGNGSDWGLRLQFAYEREPLGTAGGVLNAARTLGLEGPILVISGDALTDMDLGALIRFHQASGALATMALAEVADPHRYGVVETRAGGRIARFVEKPQGEVRTNTVNTGIYVLEPEILSHIPGEGAYDFGRDLFPALLAAGAPLYGWRNGAYWCDVGTLGSYIQANIDAAAGRVR
ncbi:MAG TPA: nucleotidyltransferase family protein, partial [Limnochordia bacterium]|nr:nucleotidyltransferase family protein [Limnochordia bacterium]